MVPCAANCIYSYDSVDLNKFLFTKIISLSATNLHDG